MAGQGAGVDPLNKVERIEQLVGAAREIGTIEQVGDRPLDGGDLHLQAEAVDDRYTIRRREALG